MKLPDQRSGLPGEVLGRFHIASLDPDQRSELAGSRPVKKQKKAQGLEAHRSRSSGEPALGYVPTPTKPDLSLEITMGVGLGL